MHSSFPKIIFSDHELALVEDDYAWLTTQLAEFCQQQDCKGIISYLEGGYALSALGRSAVAHIKALVDAP